MGTVGTNKFHYRCNLHCWSNTAQERKSVALPNEHQNNLNYNKVFARDDSILDALRTNSVLENNSRPKQVV